MVEDFDLILIHKGINEERNNNLNYVISYYTKIFNESNIILSELDIKTPLNYKIRRNYIKTNYPDYFCRSLAINNGVNLSKSKYLLISDNDCIIEHKFFDDIKKIKEILNQNEIIIPYKDKIIDLTKPQRDNLLEKKIYIKDLKKYNYRPVVSTGGVLAINRELFIKIGGYDPRFIGWGGEDDAFFVKTKLLYSVVRMNYKVFHLFHSNRENSKKHKYYRNNVRLYNEYLGLNKQQILEKINEIGFKHLTNGNK